MTPGEYAIPVPAGDRTLRPDVMLVPALGFTDEAHRIGYGGGYYDRTLAGLHAQGAPFVAWGVAYARLRVAADAHLPAAHDVALDAVATEAGWVEPR